LAVISCGYFALFYPPLCPFASGEHLLSCVPSLIAQLVASGSGDMNPTFITLVIIAVFVGVGVGLLVTRRKESECLKARYGAEYHRQVQEAGGSEGKAQ
jgi:hypothetical protein